MIKTTDLTPLFRDLALSTKISWFRIVPGKYFKNLKIYISFYFISFNCCFFLVFFKIMNENTSKFPLTTISALGCWTASSILYLFLLFLSSNCKVIYKSSNKKKRKENKTKTNHQTQLAYSHNYLKKT